MIPSYQNPFGFSLSGPANSGRAAQESATAISSLSCATHTTRLAVIITTIL